MDEEFAEQVYDQLDSIGPEMSKEEILDAVGAIQDLISDEFGWDDGPGVEEE